MLFPNTKEGLIRKFAGDMLKWFWSASIVKGVKITLDVNEKPLQIEFLRSACFEFLFCARSRAWTAGPVKGFSYTRCANHSANLGSSTRCGGSLSKLTVSESTLVTPFFVDPRGEICISSKSKFRLWNSKSGNGAAWWLSFQFATWTHVSSFSFAALSTTSEDLNVSMRFPLVRLVKFGFPLCSKSQGMWKTSGTGMSPVKNSCIKDS